MKSSKPLTPSNFGNAGTIDRVKLEKRDSVQEHDGTHNAAQESKALENVFERALRAKSEHQANTTTRVTKAPSRIKPTSKIKGWFRSHPDFILPAIDIFDPKDEGGSSDEPTFVLPNLAEELRSESSQFENAIKEVSGHLVCTMGGALYLVLVPLPDLTTGRLHPANEQKLDALEQGRFEWKRLDWNKDVKQYDDYTAQGITKEPKWPDDVSQASILARAFGERNVIKDRDDPLLVKFRGEA